MKLREVINMLGTGELANLSLFDDDGNFKEANTQKLVTSINLALTDLHKRFLLKLGTVTINLQKGQTVYPLKPVYQVGQRAPVGTVQFIENDGTYLKDNLLKVYQVFDEHGHELGLNDHDARRGVFTSSYNVLNVPGELFDRHDVRKLRVSYQMNATPLKGLDGDFDLDCAEVDIGYQHLWAMCLFIASRVHNPSGFGTGGVHEGNNYWSKYESECVNLEATNMRIDMVADNTRRLQKGFP